LNKTAYIQIALRGKNFCMAAFDGFSAIASNLLRYGAVAGVGTILMFITQLLIASAATGLFYILITYNTTIKNNIL
jgi:solute carrier family 44 (choline transporter-like protein), member 2/4/5